MQRQDSYYNNNSSSGIYAQQPGPIAPQPLSPKQSFLYQPQHAASIQHIDVITHPVVPSSLYQQQQQMVMDPSQTMMMSPQQQAQLATPISTPVKQFAPYQSPPATSQPVVTTPTSQLPAHIHVIEQQQQQPITAQPVHIIQAVQATPAPQPIYLTIPAQPVEQPLPPGWEEVTDNATGKKYFWNPTSNETTWSRPRPCVVTPTNRTLSSLSRSTSNPQIIVPANVATAASAAPLDQPQTQNQTAPSTPQPQAQPQAVQYVQYVIPQQVQQVQPLQLQPVTACNLLLDPSTNILYTTTPSGTAGMLQATPLTTLQASPLPPSQPQQQQQQSVPLYTTSQPLNFGTNSGISSPMNVVSNSSSYDVMDTASPDPRGTLRPSASIGPGQLRSLQSQASFSGANSPYGTLQRMQTLSSNGSINSGSTNPNNQSPIPAPQQQQQFSPYVNQPPQTPQAVNQYNMSQGTPGNYPQQQLQQPQSIQSPYNIPPSQGSNYMNQAPQYISSGPQQSQQQGQPQGVNSMPIGTYSNSSMQQQSQQQQQPQQPIGISSNGGINNNSNTQVR